MARRVSDTKCDAVDYRRTLATWRGAEFEVLADDGQAATLASAVGNAEVAAELELTPAGRHAWRTQAPIAQLEHVAEEVREIGVQPQFGAV
jgi:S-formylglutathione hydrolase FrmB